VQLQQVILNLIINAVEAMSGMREGARELLIVTEKAESNGALVAVRDSGPGLDLKSVDRLFEAFYTTKVQGMGIGLTICRSIIEAHGGQMWAGANEPRGAVFQFTVPLEQDETVPAGYADPMPRHKAARPESERACSVTADVPAMTALGPERRLTL
jgi:signal transduction histidine kinase